MRSSLSSLLRSKLFWLITVTLLVRAAFSSIYPVKNFPATSEYYERAQQFLSGDYSNYIGKNTPFYSWLIIAAGFDRNLLALIQTLLGTGVAVMLYLIFSRLSGNRLVGLLAGLSYSLNPSQLLFEFALLPECTTTFFVTLIALLFFRLLARDPVPGWLDFSFLGLITAACILTRPQYEFLPVLLTVSMLYLLRQKNERSLARLAAFLVTALVPLGLWAGFQHQRIGRYSLSTHLGITLMHHPINFIESAPDSYREIRDILLRARREHIRQKGDSYGSVEAAIPDLLQSTGLTYEQLDQKYFEMSVATILQKPGLYLASVGKALAGFFKPAWYSRQFGIRGVLAGNWLPSKIVALGFAAVHLACMGAFLAYPLFWLLFPGLRLKNFWRTETVSIYFLVGITAVLQALVVLGENARFRVSVEPLMIALSVWVIVATLDPGFRKDAARQAGLAAKR